MKKLIALSLLLLASTLTYPLQSYATGGRYAEVLDMSNIGNGFVDPNATYTYKNYQTQTQYTAQPKNTTAKCLNVMQTTASQVGSAPASKVINILQSINNTFNVEK